MQHPSDSSNKQKVCVNCLHSIYRKYIYNGFILCELDAPNSHTETTFHKIGDTCDDFEFNS